MKLSDFVFSFLYKQGVRHVFLISGGGNIHLVDSLGKSKIAYVCNHHEQASSTAAEGYARTTGGLGVALVTTGPGGTNAITGVAGAWLDSIPTITISGQVRRDAMGAKVGGIRQIGPQELNIIDMVRPVTKYAVTVMDANDILYHLEKAVYLATHGRKGPVWIDIPLDVQAAQIDEKKLKRFHDSEFRPPFQTDPKKLRVLVSGFLKKLRASERPVLYAGHGIRLAGALKEFRECIDLLKIPVQTGYVGYDMVPSDYPYFFGRAHSLGQRAANLIIQNSDLLVAVGARLDILTTGYTHKAFAREAYKVMVDIDANELTKPNLSVDLPVNYDAKQFLTEVVRQLRRSNMNVSVPDWLGYCRRVTRAFPNVPPSAKDEKGTVNPYHFIDVIGRNHLTNGEIIVESDGVGPLNCMYQAFYVKKNQRIILNLGLAQMGYGFPAAIGAAFAAGGKKRIICFEGDGSLQLNIHELQVVKQHRLPIKLFIYCNDGYLSIRNTQKTLFDGHYVASGSSSGLTCPDFVKVARAYGLPAIRINNHRDMEAKIRKALVTPGPMVIAINSSRNLALTPKLQTKKLPNGQFTSPPLEDMAPFLSEEELKKYMLIPLWKGTP